jgi:hypothetical protein
MERTTPMAEHATERKPKKRAAVKKDAKSALAKKVAKHAVANTEAERGARIVVLTDDPRRSVVIVPGCHIDSMPHKENAYFFEDGNELVGMIVEGGTIEYHPSDRTYVVRLTNGRHTGE